MWMALVAGLIDNDEKSSFFFLRPKWPKSILYFWLKCLKKTCPSDAGHTYIADIREHLPSPRAESKWSITSKYISKRIDCNNWYMCRQLQFIGPFSDPRLWQLSRSRRLSTYPSHPRTSHAQDIKTPAFLRLWIPFRKRNTISFWEIASCFYWTFVKSSQDFAQDFLSGWFRQLQSLE